MKKILSAMMLLAALGCTNSVVFAAELLDVKPVISESSVSIEISADIPMTYTYYKVPGQARAVVDIAEADPEKVEPLIVVNKGAVSSISVDKAQISGIVVSRVIFNLVSESDVTVTAAPDRKLLTVTFGAAAAPAMTEPKNEPKAEAQPEPVISAEPPPTTAIAPPTGAAKEDDPLGLDEPAAKPVVQAAKETTAAVATAATAAAVGTALPAATTVIRIPKLEPVVPVSIPKTTSGLSIQDITTGSTFIDVRTNKPVTDYKVSKISNPDRMFIDIATDKANQKPKSVSINKFGLSKARIGVSPKNIRIVFDSSSTGIPAYTISKTDEGLRIDFK